MVQSNNVGLIIQARMGSKRLPYKMNLKFHNEDSILDILFKNLLNEYESKDIFLATSIDKGNDILESVASRYNIKTFRGSEENVLKRFIDTAKFYNIENIIRICADNPFLQVPKIKKIIQSLINIDTDYCSYYINSGNPSIKTHSGFFVEGVKLKTLEKVAELSQNPLYLEHVTNFIYENPTMFNLKWIDFGDSLIDEIRLTIDTEHDFKVAQNIFELCDKNISIEKIYEVLRHNENLLIEMKNNIERNAK